MPRESGSLSPSDRMERIEENLDAHERSDSIMFEKIWKKIGEMEVEAARSTTRLAMIVSVVFLILSLAAQYVMNRI